MEIDLVERLLAEKYLAGNPSCKYVFSLDLLSLYRNLNLNSGLSHLSFIQALQGNFSPIKILDCQPELENLSLYRAFVDAVSEYRIAAYKLDNLEFLNVSTSEIFQGCYFCPRVIRLFYSFLDQRSWKSPRSN